MTPEPHSTSARLSGSEKLLEDLKDLAVVAERRDEPVIPHEPFLADLKRDGTL